MGDFDQRLHVDVPHGTQRLPGIPFGIELPDQVDVALSIRAVVENLVLTFGAFGAVDPVLDEVVEIPLRAGSLARFDAFDDINEQIGKPADVVDALQDLTGLRVRRESQSVPHENYERRVQGAITRRWRERSDARRLDMPIQRRVVGTEVLIVRAVTRFGGSEEPKDKTRRRRTSDAAGCLNVLRGRLRLPVHQHETEP